MCMCVFAIQQKINEKPSVIVEFESGKAVVNHAILNKIERALGIGSWLM